MKLVVLSNPSGLTDEHLLIKFMFEHGMEYFHIRKPNHTIEQIRQYLGLIPEKYWQRISLHSHHELVEEFRGVNVHFNKDNPETYEKYQLMGRKSISTHGLLELEDLHDDISYAFLSPVFNSISKQGYNAMFDLDELTKSLSELDSSASIIALGGIENDKIQRCYELGFSGVGVLGAIWEVYKESGVQQTIATFKQLLETCREFTVSQ